MKSFKDFLNEQTSLNEAHEVTVSVKDARRALDIAKDKFRGEYKNDGSNVYIFKKEDAKDDFVAELEKADIEIED